MAPGVTLRPITAGDEPFLKAVYAGTRAEELAQVAWNAAQKAAFIDMQFRAQHTYYQQAFPAAAFDVIVQDDQPIGRLYVDRSGDELQLIDISLLPEHRGHGVGTALLRALLDEAAVARVPVVIHVERFNRALRLYERLGFERVADTGVYYLLKWNPAETPRRSPNVIELAPRV